MFMELVYCFLAGMVVSAAWVLTGMVVNAAWQVLKK